MESYVNTICGTYKFSNASILSEKETVVFELFKNKMRREHGTPFKLHVAAARHLKLGPAISLAVHKPDRDRSLV